MYLNFADLFLLPYVPGFPGYLLTTLYGFLTTLLPIGALPAIRIISLVFAIILLFLLVWMAYRYRNQPIINTTPILVLALLLPSLVTPYTLLHDLVILLRHILWSRIQGQPPFTQPSCLLGSFFSLSCQH
jgi:TRAP-type C4-dicarboxylate transport system permease small subunit